MFFRWLQRSGLADKLPLSSLEAAATPLTRGDSSNGGLEDAAAMEAIGAGLLMTSDEWKVRGIDMALAAEALVEAASGEAGAAAQMLLQAADCFERAGDATQRAATVAGSGLQATLGRLRSYSLDIGGVGPLEKSGLSAEQIACSSRRRSKGDDGKNEMQQQQQQQPLLGPAEEVATADTVLRCLRAGLLSETSQLCR